MSQQQPDYYIPQVVIPGQLLAESSSSSSSSSGGGDDSFISGHGTYIVESIPTNSNDGITSSNPTTTTTLQLRASICGTIQRINKLISVESMALYHYAPNVGDLMIGRVRTIQNDKWILDLCNHVTGKLPLSSVHLPGKASMQRKRTANDVLEMRRYIKEGDLVSCEVHKVHGGNQNTNNIMLHTRSIRYGKLENGCLNTVPSKLILRRKTHYTTIIENQFQILIGCNGMIWIQRNNNPTTNTEPSTSVSSIPSTTTADNSNNHDDDTVNNMDQRNKNENEDDDEKTGKENNKTMILGQQELAEAEEIRRLIHSETVYSLTDRQNLARIRNSIYILRCTLSYITPELVTSIYYRSCSYPPTSNHIANMLLPESILQLTTTTTQQPPSKQQQQQ